jgi:hypothetical protein
MMAQIPLINSDEFAQIDDADYPWASQHIWRIHEDGHVVRDGMDEYGHPTVIYMCNEVVSRRTGIPLREFNPPRSAKERQGKAKWR